MIWEIPLFTIPTAVSCSIGTLLLLRYARKLKAAKLEFQQVAPEQMSHIHTQTQTHTQTHTHRHKHTHTDIHIRTHACERLRHSHTHAHTHTQTPTDRRRRVPLPLRLHRGRQSHPHRRRHRLDHRQHSRCLPELEGRDRRHRRMQYVVVSQGGAAGVCAGDGDVCHVNAVEHKHVRDTSAHTVHFCNN